MLELRRALAWSSLLLPLAGLAATDAWAAPAVPTKTAGPKAGGGSVKAQCIAAHEAGLSLRNEKKPHAARAKFVQCARNECPVVLRKECADLIATAEKEAPTVLLEAKDDKGGDTTAVKVSLDGNALVARLTGAAVEVEPGEHVFKFERDDGKTIEQRVLVGEGEKNKKVVADYAALLPKKVVEEPHGARETPKKAEIPVISWVAGGVAVVALGSFTVFALTGKSKESDLASSCSPRCTDDEVSGPKTSYLIADVSLGVGIVAAAVAIYFALPAITGRGAVNASASRLGPPPWLPQPKVVGAGVTR